MTDGVKDGYRRARRGLVGVALGAAVTLAGVLGAVADEYGEYGEAKKVGTADAYAEYEYQYAPYAVSYENETYLYATGEDGKAHYYTYDGEYSAEPYEYAE